MSTNKAAYRVVDGWLHPAQHFPSPNCEPRPEGAVVDLLVLHSISLPPGHFRGDAVTRFFTNQLDFGEHPWFEAIRDLRVSAHLFIRRHGTVQQFVSFDQRAWHAGLSCHEGRDNCNDFSIGIEMEGSDERPYTAAQYRHLNAVSQALITAYPALDASRVVGHCDIAPGRKTDPGPLFDWSSYRRRLVEACQP